MKKIKTSLRQYAAQHNLEHLTDEFVSDGDLTPDTIGFDSLKEVKWICSYGHTETESPHKRVRRGYCSVCGPERKGSAAQVCPDILKYWNDPRDPYKTSPTCTEYIQWKCPQGHIWKRRLTDQIKLNSCPDCKKKENSFFAHHPEMLKEWDSDKNGSINPDTLPAFSQAKYYWCCRNGHSYKASPAYLMRHKIRCPICASFGFKYPLLAKEWHPTKNGDKTPFDYLPGSRKPVWFKCSVCGEEYQRSIYDLCKRKSKTCHPGKKP